VKGIFFLLKVPRMCPFVLVSEVGFMDYAALEDEFVCCRKESRFKAKFLLNNIYRFRLYLTGNKLHLRYRTQPVNAVWGTVAVCCEIHAEHTDTLCGQKAGIGCAEAGGVRSKHGVLKDYTYSVDGDS
jgi:hypothetical protein